MQEVRDESATVRRQGGWEALAFWLLATLGVGLFAISVLATSFMERQQAVKDYAARQAGIQQDEQYVKDLRDVRDALQDNPKYVARQIRKDLGYSRPDEQPLPFATEQLGVHRETLAPEYPPEPKIARVFAVFAQPTFRHLSLTAGLMLIVMAFLIFEIPTRREEPNLAPAPVQDHASGPPAGLPPRTL